ncbi:hypothetical protein, partial [Nitrosovibrio tenuis]
VYSCFGIFIIFLSNVTSILHHPWKTIFRGKLTRASDNYLSQLNQTPYINGYFIARQDRHSELFPHLHNQKIISIVFLKLDQSSINTVT